jgi:hypothetical protein
MQHFVGVKIIRLFCQQQNNIACLPTPYKRGVSRGSAPRIPDLDIRWRLVAIHAPAALPPGKKPVHIHYGASWAPERVWTFRTIGNASAPAWNQTLVCPNRSLVTVVASRNSKPTGSRYVPRLIRITAFCVHQLRDCPTDTAYCDNIVSNCDKKHKNTETR